jgi:hypothetical protein
MKQKGRGMTKLHEAEFSLELTLGGTDAGGEVIATIMFSHTPGSPAHMGSPTPAGRRAEPATSEIETITLADEDGNPLECPKWLYDRIEKYADRDVLAAMAEEY